MQSDGLASNGETPPVNSPSASSYSTSHVSTPKDSVCPAMKQSGSDLKAAPPPDSFRFQKRMYPDWRPLDYREWDLYPDQKERRHTGMWRGDPTTDEVTIERALGRSQHGGDTRNGIALVHGGDKCYPSPEYSPGFFLTESHNPSHVLGLGRFRLKPQSIVPVPTKNPVDLFAERQRHAQKQAETEEVRRLDDWVPSSSGALYLS